MTQDYFYDHTWTQERIRLAGLEAALDQGTARRTPTSAATVHRGDENVVPLGPPGIGYMGNT